MSRAIRVKVSVEPGPNRPRPDARRPGRLITDYSKRVGDPSSGGSTRHPVMTAYRQRAVACAAVLRADSGRRTNSGWSRPMLA